VIEGQRFFNRGVPKKGFAMKAGKKAMGLMVSAPLIGLLCGCAGNAGNATAAAPAQTSALASAEDSAKAEKKISMAIGREVGKFALTGRQEIEAPAGYVGTQYTVKTTGGETYKCEILEPSGFGKLATWGMASGAGAMCTNFTEGSKDRGKTNKASCNELLRAANKC
jgi:hypothetical protein